MYKRAVSGAMLVLMLVGMFAPTFNLQSARCESATVVVVPGAAGQLPPPDSWVDSGISLSFGDDVSITATGLVSWDQGYNWAGPDGDPSWPSSNGFDNPILPGAPVAALIAKIGGGPIFLVGSGPTAANGEGKLIFAVNDQIGGNYNNIGSFTVTIVRARGQFTIHWASQYYGVTTGEQTSFVIYLDYTAGFSGLVKLSFQGLPTGCVGQFDIAEAQAPTVPYRTLFVTTPSNLNNGTYTFTVKGESGSVSQTIPVTLTVGTGEITGIIYRDDNGNGIRDPGEPPVSGATVGYYATQNYMNLYQTGVTSDANGAFTLVNVPFNVDNEVDATATGLRQRDIRMNIMNRPETQLNIGMLTPPASGWSTCTQFNIAFSSVSFSEYLRPFVEAYNLLHPFDQISIDSINSLPPVNFYTITQSSSADQAEFAQALSQFLGITSPQGYNPAYVYILEFPFLQTINALFGASIQGPITIPIPPSSGVSLLLSAQSISTTPGGNVILAFTFSKTTNSAKGIFDLLRALASTLVTIAKMDPVDLIKDGVDLFKATIETSGEDSINVITSDLYQTGQLTSYTLIDMVHIADTLSTLTTAGGIVKKTIHLLMHGTAAASLIDVPDDVRTILDALDLTLEILPYMPAMSFLQNNTLFQLFMTGEGIIVSAVDPNGTTIVPSVLDMTGSLVVGYNFTSGDVTYASIEGILVPAAGDWLVLLNESASNPVSYTVCLSAMGGNASVPYNLQILSSNQNVTAIGYSGMVFGGTSLTIPVDVAPNGTLVQQDYLEPSLSVNETGNIFDFVATGFLSNGSLVPVDEAYLSINGSQYEMTQINSSTYETQIGINSSSPVQFNVYMISYSVPGGFATGTLRHEVAVDNLTLTKTVVGLGYGLGLNATLRNQGDFDETLNVTIYANSTVLNQTEIDVSSTSSSIMTFTWNTSGFAEGNFTVKVCVEPLLGETNMSNNNVTYALIKVTVPGDVNGDFNVDIYDAIILAGAYNSKTGDPNWKPNADINNDKIIDIYDAIILAGHFNQHYP